MGWTQYAPVGGAALALVLAALIRVARRRGTREDIDISPTMLGYLTGGVRRAVITAIAMLHVRGAVRVGRPGTVKHADGRFASTDRLLAATYAAIYQPNGPSGIMARPQVRRAETEVRRELVAAGLLVPTGNWLAFRWLTWLSGPLLAAQLATSHSAMSIGLVVVVFVVGGLLYGRDRRTRTARARTRQLGRQSARTRPASATPSRNAANARCASSCRASPRTPDCSTGEWRPRTTPTPPSARTRTSGARNSHAVNSHFGHHSRSCTLN